MKVERVEGIQRAHYKSRCSAFGRTTDLKGGMQIRRRLDKASACEARNVRIAARAFLMRGAGEAFCKKGSRRRRAHKYGELASHKEIMNKIPRYASE